MSGGDLFAISWRIAFAVGVPLFLAAFLTTRLDASAPSWEPLGIILVGIAAAGLGMFFVLRGLTSGTPQVSDAARAAGRKWDAEVRAEERKRDEDDAR
jgi:drug/metabolite transporter (DMT)-like permease